MKAEILKMLRETDSYVSGQELCNKFGVSRTAVWKAINQLKENGYEIEAVQNKGYHLLSAPDVMDVTELESIHSTEWAGCELYYYDSIDSTNTKAKELAEDGHPSGTLVVADQQTAGKGRRGRSWESPMGTGIFMTLMLKPEINPNNASMLTLVAAMATTRAIRRVTGVPAMIKWPNDIVMNGKKVCGILTEMSAQFNYINHIVIGIGINVHNEEFPEEIKETASSLFLESGQHIHRASLIEAFLEEFEDVYAEYLKTEDMEGLQKEYDTMLVNRGRQVRVLDPKEPFEGVALGITSTGELRVRKEDGTIAEVHSGEVSVRGLYSYV
jgi:BirA family biotin operon repressor/biotin-[acetyl-CoA-carboxylase] ligase